MSVVYVVIYKKYLSATEGKHFHIPLWYLEAASCIHKPQYYKTIGKRKQLYRQVYKLYDYVIN